MGKIYKFAKIAEFFFFKDRNNREAEKFLSYKRKSLENFSILKNSRKKIFKLKKVDEKS